MPLLVDTIEDRLRLALGAKDFEIIALQTEIDRLNRQLTDADAEVERLRVELSNGRGDS